MTDKTNNSARSASSSSGSASPLTLKMYAKFFDLKINSAKTKIVWIGLKKILCGSLPSLQMEARLWGGGGHFFFIRNKCFCGQRWDCGQRSLKNNYIKLLQWCSNGNGVFLRPSDGLLLQSQSVIIDLSHYQNPSQEIFSSLTQSLFKLIWGQIVIKLNAQLLHSI